jgi:hypothetical protein
MRLNIYVKTATNKRLLIFESRDDSNLCTPYREKSDTHNTYASRTNPRTPHICFLRAVHVRGNLSLAIKRWTDLTTPEKMDSRHNPQHAGWPIHRSATQFLSQDNHWSSNESQTSVDNKLHQFTGPITPVCDRYVQYLFIGSNPSALNWHRRGLQPWRCQLFTYHSLTLPTSGLHFPSKGPARSPVKSQTNKGSKVQDLKTYGRHVVFGPLSHS